MVVKKYFVLICLAIGFFGCARTMTDFAPFTIDSVTSQTGQDIILTTGDIDRPYKELGVIVVRGRRASGEKIMESLKAEAKEAVEAVVDAAVAEETKEAKEKADKLNSADAMIFQTEKQLKE